MSKLKRKDYEELLESLQEELEEEYRQRRDMVVDMLNAAPGIACHKPEGAFYVFIDIRKCPLADDIEFCERLLEEKLVAAVPGAAFFAPGFVRFSYACSMENIKEGMARLKDFLKGL